MRLIDADALSEVLNVKKNCEDCDYQQGMFCSKSSDFVNACEAIFDAPTIEPEPHWIPCSERLPEKNGRYLVTRGLKACNSIWNRVYIINYSDLMGLKAEKIWWDGNVGKSDFQSIDDVVAWRELPETWRGEGK